MDHRRLADSIAGALGLDLPPVALAFRDAAPDGIPENDAVVPSACAFWRRAESGVFYAPVAGHRNCPIGALVMGFELEPRVMAELEAIVGRMTACGYVEATEPSSIPVNRRKARGVVYGPLKEFPVPPDAVLLWLNPTQAMIWSEATGGAAWNGPAPSTVFGRPACAAIPAALDAEAPRLSLGCIGMRTFTGIPADRMLAVVPGGALEAFAEALARTTEVNRTMAAFYQGRLGALSS